MLSFFSDKYPGMGLLYNMVVLFLIFWGISVLFSTVAAPIYISINSLFSMSLPASVICCLFDNSHSDRCEVIILLWFLFAFPRLVILSIFTCTCWPSMGPSVVVGWLFWQSGRCGPPLVWLVARPLLVQSLKSTDGWNWVTRWLEAAVSWV